jgi:GWxTD domain-containing protein
MRLPTPLPPSARSSRPRPVSVAVAASLIALAAVGACRLYNLERKLGPDDAAFLARVQYIITSQERKAFLEMPASERAAFEEDFWKRRDPDPATEVNEFKTTYFARMDEADKLFLGEGRPGWQTDRGRVYILFGPPQERITQSFGQSAYGRCSEVWYYGSFPVVFSDSNCTGSYVLVTLNLEHLHDLNQALASFQTNPEPRMTYFDFRGKVDRIAAGPDRIEASVTIETPYAGLWLEPADGRLRTTLEIGLELVAASGETVWTLSRDEEVSVAEAKLAELRGRDYVLVLPLLVTDKAGLLLGRTSQLKIRLRNQTGGEEAKKVLEVAF